MKLLADTEKGTRCLVCYRATVSRDEDCVMLFVSRFGYGGICIGYIYDKWREINREKFFDDSYS